jgi:hypothetical protein
MVAAIQNGSFVPEAAKWANVQRYRANIKNMPPQDVARMIGTLIGYNLGPNCIHLEDGTTRLTATALETVLPATIPFFLRMPATQR